VAYELDDGNDNLVLFDDVVVRYDRGLSDAEPDAVQKARARARLRADTTANGNDIKSVAARALDLESRADTARGERENQANALRNIEAIADTQGDTLNSLSTDQLALANRVADTEEGVSAASQAIEETTSQAARNAEDIIAAASRLSSLELTTADQQAAISTKASQSRLDQVESDAASARGMLKSQIEAEYRDDLADSEAAASGARDALQADIRTRATESELAEVEANAESARSQLQTTLSSQIGDNTAFIQNTAETVDGISAQQVFKVSAGGAIAGLGLATGPTGDDGVTQSRIRFYANQFAFITDDADGSPSFPVTIQGSKAMLNTALIGEAQITDAMIRNLAANKIVADELSAISGNMGTLTAGTIVCGATDGVGGRVVLDGDSEYAIWAGSGGRSAQNANFYLTRNGDAIANNIRARGDIEATSIKADSANIVSTLMLQGDAVTIPLGDSNDSRTSINSTNWKTLASVYIKASDFQYAKTVMVFVGADFDLQYLDILNGPSGGTELQTRLIKEEKKYFDMDLDVLTPGSILKRPFSTARMINVGNSSGYLYLQARMSSYKQGMNFDALNRYIALLGLKDG
tara:strand:- start:1267 stop:3018 length:1752 start_codon:yes stop_codon:yes gene_type:complete